MIILMVVGKHMRASIKELSTCISVAFHSLSIFHCLTNVAFSLLSSHGESFGYDLLYCCFQYFVFMQVYC